MDITGASRAFTPAEAVDDTGFFDADLIDAAGEAAQLADADGNPLPPGQYRSDQYLFINRDNLAEQPNLVEGNNRRLMLDFGVPGLVVNQLIEDGAALANAAVHAAPDLVLAGTILPLSPRLDIAGGTGNAYAGTIAFFDTKTGLNALEGKPQNPVTFLPIASGSVLPVGIESQTVITIGDNGGVFEGEARYIAVPGVGTLQLTENGSTNGEVLGANLFINVPGGGPNAPTIFLRAAVPASFTEDFQAGRRVEVNGNLIGLFNVLPTLIDRYPALSAVYDGLNLLGRTGGANGLLDAAPQLLGGIGWNVKAVFEDGTLVSVKIAGFELPVAQLLDFLRGKGFFTPQSAIDNAEFRPPRASQIEQRYGVLPLDEDGDGTVNVPFLNYGSDELASRNDTLHAIYGTSVWDIGWASLVKDADGAAMLTDYGDGLSMADARDHGNPISAVAGQLYEAAYFYGVLAPDERIRDNAHASEIIDQILDRVMANAVESPPDGTADLWIQSDYFGPVNYNTLPESYDRIFWTSPREKLRDMVLDQLANPYQIDFGNAALADYYARANIDVYGEGRDLSETWRLPPFDFRSTPFGPALLDTWSNSAATPDDARFVRAAFDGTLSIRNGPDVNLRIRPDAGPVVVNDAA